MKDRGGVKKRSSSGPGSQSTTASKRTKLLPSSAKTSRGTGVTATPVQTSPSSPTSKEPSPTTRLASSPADTSPRVTAAAKGRTKVPEPRKTRNRRTCELRIYNPDDFRRAKQWHKKRTGRDFSEESDVEGTDMNSYDRRMKEQARVAALIRGYLRSIGRLPTIQDVERRAREFKMEGAGQSGASN